MLAKKFRVPVQFFPKQPPHKQQNEFFVVKYAPSAHRFNRVGVVVSAKTAKTATARNKIRRFIMTVLQSRTHFFKETSSGVDAVVIVKSAAAHVPLSRVASALVHLLSHTHV